MHDMKSLCSGDGLIVAGLVTSETIVKLSRGQVGSSWRAFVRIHFHGTLREVFCIVEATVIYEREIGICTIWI